MKGGWLLGKQAGGLTESILSCQVTRCRLAAMASDPYGAIKFGEFRKYMQHKKAKLKDQEMELYATTRTRTINDVLTHSSFLETTRAYQTIIESSKVSLYTLTGTLILLRANYAN